jgi:hypothetical protein
VHFQFSGFSDESVHVSGFSRKKFYILNSCYNMVVVDAVISTDDLSVCANGICLLCFG